MANNKQSKQPEFGHELTPMEQHQGFPATEEVGETLAQEHQPRPDYAGESFKKIRQIIDRVRSRKR